MRFQQISDKAFRRLWCGLVVATADRNEISAEIRAFVRRMTACQTPPGDQLIMIFIHQRIMAVYFRPQIDAITQRIESCELKEAKRRL